MSGMCQNIHMPTSRTLLGIFLGALLAVGCAPATSDVASSEAAIGEEEAGGAGITGVEAEGLLLYVNDRGNTTLEKLSALPFDVAQKIVQYRTDDGGKGRWFKTVDDLLQIKGIGSATLDKNRERVTAASSK